MVKLFIVQSCSNHSHDTLGIISVKDLDREIKYEIYRSSFVADTNGFINKCNASEQETPDWAQRKEKEIFPLQIYKRYEKKAILQELTSPQMSYLNYG